jgi:hypothetical protein
MISALIELLGKHYQSGDVTQLEVIARTIRAVIPGDVIGLQVLGMAYLKIGRTADAESLFRRADIKGRKVSALQSKVDGNGASLSPIPSSTSISLAAS